MQKCIQIVTNANTQIINEIVLMIIIDYKFIENPPSLPLTIFSSIKKYGLKFPILCILIMLYMYSHKAEKAKNLSDGPEQIKQYDMVIFNQFALFQ
jgi:hypothetical protein